MLTGGPGCGKTYLTKHFAHALHAAGTPVVLVASTGTAATRLSRFATTAHGFFMLPIGGMHMKNPCAVVANSDRRVARVAAAPVLVTSNTGVPAARSA